MPSVKQQQGTLPEDMWALLQSGEGADITVVGEDCRLAAHSSVLLARSPVFATMLCRHMQQLVIEIPDMPERVLRQLLTFIYTDEAPHERSLAPVLLALADRYELPVLKQMCEQIMAEDLCVENATPYAVLALRHSCPHLRRAAIGFIVKHTLPVLGSEGWIRECLRDSRPLVEISRLVAAEALQETRMEELQTMLARGGLTDKEDVCEDVKPVEQMM